MLYGNCRIDRCGSFYFLYSGLAANEREMRESFFGIFWCVFGRENSWSTAVSQHEEMRGNMGRTP
jgi:hypothetical protein